MKKLILVFAMALAGTLAFAQTNEGKTLYVIDGVVSSKEAADQLPSNMIKNMNVVKGVESVIVITTHEGREISGNAPQNRVVLKDLNDDGVVSVRGVKKAGGDPLYVVKSANGKIKKVDNLESISPNDIKTMHVYKDDKSAEQFKKYGDTTNGVVLVELK